MINDVGKTVATVHLSSHILTMMNVTVTDTKSIDFLEDDNTTVRYKMSFDTSAFGCRALFYSRSFAGDAIDETLRPVIYVPPSVDASNGASSNSNIPVTPLYECIAPVAVKHSADVVQLTWWSNTSSVLTKNPDTDNYDYDYSKIKKFYTSKLDDIKDTKDCSKILCTASIGFERLKQKGTDTMPYDIPIIKNVVILACISGEGYIVDFSTGGGGGGNGSLGIHNHLSNLEGGFAGAVFMPSAVPRVISWR